MKSFICILSLILFLTPHSALSNEMTKLHSEARTLLSGIEAWQAIELKKLLTQRIDDNQDLINLIQNNERHLTETELDKDYKAFLNGLIEDQQALLVITNYLSTIDRDHRLHLDIYLSRKPALRKKIERLLSHNLHTASSRNVVNQVLYFTLMEKHASR